MNDDDLSLVERAVAGDQDAFAALYERYFDRVFDFLAHPSCLVVEDPTFETVKLICSLVKDAGDKAAIVGLDEIAKGVQK